MQTIPLPPKRFALLLLGLVLTVFSSTCTSMSGKTFVGPPPLNRAPAPSPASFLTASFPQGRFGAVSAPNAVLLAIENDGHFQIFLDGDLLDAGMFDISGSRALVESITCAAIGQKPALYEWLYDPEVGLAFQPANPDPCAERQQYLSEVYMPKYMFVLESPDRGVSGDWLG